MNADEVSALRLAVLQRLAWTPARGFELWDDLVRQGVIGHSRRDRLQTMRSLQYEGLVTATWVQSPFGPRVRAYSVTEAGRSYLLTQGAVARD